MFRADQVLSWIQKLLVCFWWVTLRRFCGGITERIASLQLSLRKRKKSLTLSRTIIWLTLFVEVPGTPLCCVQSFLKFFFLFRPDVGLFFSVTYDLTVFYFTHRYDVFYGVVLQILDGVLSYQEVILLELFFWITCGLHTLMIHSFIVDSISALKGLILEKILEIIIACQCIIFGS